ncbi:hypothetical protein [Kallotenue papyrolyticum]|uniref:hypothetical protein n=1 Tax=Kallotenue papyrolyticum TaxID=1325125 RepID=UPI00047866BA|nr:hypothetical protein [Kallotenue papyrolyticum]
MTHTTNDPAQENVRQSAREQESFGGQQGPGVDYEDGQFRRGVTRTPEQGRTGSYESENRGGYGTGQPDADGERHADEAPVSPMDEQAGPSSV